MGILEAMMAVLFPSDEWIKLMMEELNASKAYLEAAKNWEGDFLFVVEPGGSLRETISLYMDLHHGKCRAAYQYDHTNGNPPPAFTLSGPIGAWKKVMTKKLDPIQSMMTGQLKLRGNLAVVMRNVRAAKELVESCTHIDTVFPL
jgi:putative sterol carrier protein